MMPGDNTTSAIYNSAFFGRIEKGAQSSAHVILSLLHDHVPFASMTDVGGGTGSWSRAALDLGVKTVTLVDGAYVDPDGLCVPPDSFVEHDLSKRLRLPARSDLAVSMEVAEHLSPKRAESFVQDLCAISDNVLFSAALPFQGGDGHVNEIWPEYWAELFDRQGYDCFDFIRPRVWTDPTVDWWYRQNVLFFSARPESDAAPREIAGAPARKADEPLTRIHPAGYVWLAYRLRPAAYRTAAQRVIKLHEDISRLGKPSYLGYGGEFDSVPRPELMDLDHARLRAVIVGPGRTGSTALANSLSDHPGMFCLNESQELPLLEARFGADPAPTAAIVEGLRTAQFGPGTMIAAANARRAGNPKGHLEAFLNRLVVTEPEMTVSRFARYVAAYFQGKGGGRILVDKTPDYAHHLDSLLALWPDLRVVLMVRAPGPTAVSMRGHHGYRTLAALGRTSWAGLLASDPDLAMLPPGDAPEDLAPYLDIWSARVRDALEVGERLDPTQFTTLRYENLCADPRGEGRRLLRFLGADPDPDWLDRLAESFTPRPDRASAATREAERAVAAHDGALALNLRLGYARTD